MFCLCMYVRMCVEVIVIEVFISRNKLSLVVPFL